MKIAHDNREPFVAPKGPKTTLIKIKMESSEGITETWTAGRDVTEEGLLARWERDNPTLAPLYKSHELVTPTRPKRDTTIADGRHAPSLNIYARVG